MVLAPHSRPTSYIASLAHAQSSFSGRCQQSQIPALHELARAALRLLFNGDTSQWDRALQMPHYNTRSMPAISMHTGMHLIQVRRCRGCLHC